jgi:hypothetical protein
MLSATVNASNFGQINPNQPKTAQNLPKFAQRQNFEIPPKIEILVFLKNKNFYV